MPLVKLPMTKGAFTNAEAFELGNPDFAVALENLLLNDAGSNVDRPGLGSFAAIGGSPVIGLHAFKNYLVAVTEARRTYSISSTGDVQDITGSALLGGSGRPVFADDGTYLAIASGGAPKRWTAAAVAEVQTITFSNTPNAGNFVLNIAAQATSSLAYNSTTAAIQTALRALNGYSDITVTGSFGAGLVVTFGGAQLGADGPLITVTSNTLNLSGAATTVTVTETQKGYPAGRAALQPMPGSPPDCSQIIYVDGYWILPLLNDQECRIAGPTPAARETWDTSDFFQAEGLPDDIRTIAVILREVWTVSETSTEIFQNVGDPTTPFQRAFFIDRGTPAPASIVSADNTLWMLDDRRNFVFFNGRTPQVISVPFSKELQAMTQVADCWGQPLEISGHSLIVWTFPTEQKTYVFDQKTREFVGTWRGNSAGDPARFRMDSYAKSWNRHFCGDFETGTVWEMSTGYKTDGAQVMKRLRRTGLIDHGSSNRKRSKGYVLDVKRGTGVTGATEPVCELRFRDDGGTWRGPIAVGLGSVGDDKSFVTVRAPGIYKKRQIEISITDGVDFILRGVEEDVELLGS